MTHKTGPRPEKIAAMKRAIWRSIRRIRPTVSETFTIMHDMEMELVRGMLRPWEDETCPTCDKDTPNETPKTEADDWLIELFR